MAPRPPWEPAQAPRARRDRAMIASSGTPWWFASRLRSEIPSRRESCPSGWRSVAWMSVTSWRIPHAVRAFLGGWRQVALEAPFASPACSGPRTSRSEPRAGSRWPRWARIHRVGRCVHCDGVRRRHVFPVHRRRGLRCHARGGAVSGIAHPLLRFTREGACISSLDAGVGGRLRLPHVRVLSAPRVLRGGCHSPAVRARAWGLVHAGCVGCAFVLGAVFSAPYREPGSRLGLVSLNRALSGCYDPTVHIVHPRGCHHGV